MMSSVVALALLVSVAGGGEAGPARAAEAAGLVASVQPGGVVNDRCPIQGEEIDPESPTRVWRGKTIGFCCPGCEEEWDAKPERDKDAFLAKYVAIGAESAALTTVRRFQEALTAGDLGALDALVLGAGRATVLENGADAGPWERYRDERLKARLKSMSGAVWTPSVEAEERVGPVTVVRQTGTMSLGSGEAARRTPVAITYVIVEEGGAAKIAHLHRSTGPAAAAK